MRNFSIQFNDNSVTVYGPEGAVVENPAQKFIDFLYMDLKEFDTIFDTKIDNAKLSNSDLSFVQMTMDKFSNNKFSYLTNELEDMKKNKSYFYEKARVYLDENPSVKEYKSLAPRERYAKHNDLNETIRCSISLDRNTMEPIETYYPENIKEACYIFLIKMIVKNSLIKKCGYCGNFFEKKQGHSNEYCNRLIPGKNKTCKDVGAFAIYNRISKDDFQKIFEKHYKKVSAYCKRHNLKESFDNWNHFASDLRAQARSAGMPIEIFDIKLKEIEDDMVYKNRFHDEEA